MVDATRSPTSGRELAALGRDGRPPAMLAASAAGWRREPAQTRQIAHPSARDRGINHLVREGDQNPVESYGEPAGDPQADPEDAEPPAPRCLPLAARARKGALEHLARAPRLHEGYDAERDRYGKRVDDVEQPDRRVARQRDQSRRGEDGERAHQHGGPGPRITA